MLRTDAKSFQDHPHAYGDKLFFYFLIGAPTGSSPRVWGQALTYPSLYAAERIIPTRMGTRSRSRSGTARRKDHPHAYGDKYRICTYNINTLGSSPRVWGQGKPTSGRYMYFGIIPTRMGTSSL